MARGRGPAQCEQRRLRPGAVDDLFTDAQSDETPEHARLIDTVAPEGGQIDEMPGRIAERAVADQQRHAEDEVA